VNETVRGKSYFESSYERNNGIIQFRTYGSNIRPELHEPFTNGLILCVGVGSIEKHCQGVPVLWDQCRSIAITVHSNSIVPQDVIERLLQSGGVGRVRSSKVSISQMYCQVSGDN
jgi:hypothetical protein